MERRACLFGTAPFYLTPLLPPLLLCPRAWMVLESAGLEYSACHSLNPQEDTLSAFTFSLSLNFRALSYMATLSPLSVSLSSRKGGKPTKQLAQWYGADYTAVVVEENDPADTAELIEAWDGCTYMEAIGESPNVPGIGEVSQVAA